MLLTDIDTDALEAMMERLSVKTIRSIMPVCKIICTAARHALSAERYRERKGAALTGAKLSRAMQRTCRRLGASDENVLWFTHLPIDKFLLPKYGLSDLFEHFFNVPRDFTEIDVNDRPLTVGMAVVVLGEDGAPMTHDHDEDDDFSVEGVDGFVFGFVKAIDADTRHFEVQYQRLPSRETASLSLPATRIRPRWPSAAALSAGVCALQDWHPSAFAHLMLCLTRRDSEHDCLFEQEQRPWFETGATMIRDGEECKQIRMADTPALETILSAVGNSWDDDISLDGVSQWFAGALIEASDGPIENHLVEYLVGVVCRAVFAAVAHAADAARVLNVFLRGSPRPPVRSVWEHADLDPKARGNGWVLSCILYEGIEYFTEGSPSRMVL